MNRLGPLGLESIGLVERFSRDSWASFGPKHQPALSTDLWWLLVFFFSFCFFRLWPLSFHPYIDPYSPGALSIALSTHAL